MTRLFLPFTLALLIGCNQHPKQQTANLPPRSDSPKTITDSAGSDSLPHSAAKDDAYNDNMPVNLPPGLATFLPKGYEALDTSGGDINRDSLRDMILICRTKDRDSLDIETPGPRPLLILTGQPDGSFKLAARNDNVVLCRTCGGAMGDPYQQTVIKKGYFSLEYYGGAAERWSRIVTFKYVTADNDWRLHKISEDSYNCTEEDPKHTINTWSEKDLGTIPFTKYNSDTIYNLLTSKLSAK